MKERVRSLFRAIRPLRAVRYALHWLRNRWRGRFRQMDYILLVLPPVMPALPEPRSWLRRRIFGDPPMSLTDLDRHFRQIGADPRPRGVILHLRGFALPLADLQTLRASILRLRESGKRV